MFCFADRLRAGESLTTGQSITSTSGEYYLKMQSDGNLVLYRRGYVASWHTFTWAQDQTQRSCNMIETLCRTKGVLPSGIQEPLDLKIPLLILWCRTMGAWCYTLVLARTSGQAFTIEDVRDKHLYAFQKAKHYIENKQYFVYSFYFICSSTN